jgi:hypothetical protein
MKFKTSIVLPRSREELEYVENCLDLMEKNEFDESAESFLKRVRVVENFNFILKTFDTFLKDESISFVDAEEVAEQRATLMVLFYKISKIETRIIIEDIIGKRLS